MKTRIEVNHPVVTGFVDDERVVQFRATESGDILTDTSACLPAQSPQAHVKLYADCLAEVQALAVSMVKPITPSVDPEGMLYVVNPRGYCFRVEPGVKINGALLEKTTALFLPQYEKWPWRCVVLLGLMLGHTKRLKDTRTPFCYEMA